MFTAFITEDTSLQQRLSSLQRCKMMQIAGTPFYRPIEVLRNVRCSITWFWKGRSQSIGSLVPLAHSQCDENRAFCPLDDLASFLALAWCQQQQAVTHDLTAHVCPRLSAMAAPTCLGNTSISLFLASPKSVFLPYQG